MISGHCPHLKIDWKNDTLSVRPEQKLKRAVEWHERVKEQEEERDK